MRAIHDYIIEINQKFKDYILLDNKQKIFVDTRFTSAKNANVLHTIKQTPVVNPLNINSGDKVIIDPIVMHEFLDQDGVSKISTNQIFSDKNLFKISIRNIYFVIDENGCYISPNDYVLAKKIKAEQTEPISGLIIPKSNAEFDKYKVKILSNSVSNPLLIKNAIATTNVELGAPFYIEQEEFLLFREKHFFAIN